MSEPIEELTVNRRSKFDLDFTRIHEIINPADVRETDRILARLRKRSDSSSDYDPLRVWRLSPLGVELVYPDTDLALEKGDAVDLEITISGQRMYFEGLIVDLIQQNELIRLIGIRFSRRTERGTSDDRRRSPRWICSDEYFPTCVAPTPGILNDYMLFQIRDISPEGMQLICSLRNKFLIPDMTIRITANFPMVGDFVAAVRIARVGFTTDAGKDKLAVGVEFVNLTDHMRKVLGQYLIQFSNVDSLDELRALGFTPPSIANAVSFYFLKTEQDYRNVLSLRHLAHITDNNLKDQSVRDVDMGDIHDAEARIIVGKHADRIVATARVRFNSLDQPLEHEEFVDWPERLPRRDLIIEVSRVCTHPDYRRGDLLAGLFQFACATSIQHERPWVLIGSWSEMVPFYKRLGFRDTGISHAEPLWNSRQHLMLGNARDTMLGRGVNPLYWNLIWRTVSDHTIDNGMINPTGLDRVRLLVYRTLAPISRLAVKMRRSPRKRSR